MEHFEYKAYRGYEHFTLAVFFQARDDMVLSYSDENVVEKYNDRYSLDMTYKD